MSLDFYLKSQKPVVEECHCAQCGNKHEKEEFEYYFSSNITHNLTKMADVAGIYEALWHPEQIDAKEAKQLIPILEVGLKKLKENPEEYKKYNAPNGWGMYEHFVPFVEEVLQACKKHPESFPYSSV